MREEVASGLINTPPETPREAHPVATIFHSSEALESSLDLTLQGGRSPRPKGCFLITKELFDSLQETGCAFQWREHDSRPLLLVSVWIRPARP